MKRETCVTLTLYNRGFCRLTLSALIDKCKTGWAIDDWAYVNNNGSGSHATFIKFYVSVCNDTTDYNELENKIQREIDALELLRDNMELIKLSAQRNPSGAEYGGMI